MYRKNTRTVLLITTYSVNGLRNGILKMFATLILIVTTQISAKPERDSQRGDTYIRKATNSNTSEATVMAAPRPSLGSPAAKTSNNWVAPGNASGT